MERPRVSQRKGDLDQVGIEAESAQGSQGWKEKQRKYHNLTSEGKA